MECAIRTAVEADCEAMLEIYRPYVLRTSISFEWEAPSPEEFRTRVRETLKTHPWLVAESQGEILGYAYATPHRYRKAYQWACECSVYMKASSHRRGIASALYRKLLAILKEQGFVNAYGGISLPNSPSVHFHEAMGFKPLCVFPNAGFKLNAWHDVGWWICALNEPAENPRAPIAFSGLPMKI